MNIKLKKITEEFIKNVWKIENIEEKRNYVINFIGLECNTITEKKIREKILKTKNSFEIDTIISNMYLKEKELGVL